MDFNPFSANTFPINYGGFYSGGGHGYYEPAILLFPAGLISILIFNEIAMPFIILAIIQYPVYGLMMDRSFNKRKTQLFILAFHFVLVILIFMTKGSTWE
jgi:hypothetical protein